MSSDNLTKMKGEKRKRSIALKMRSGNLTKMKGKKKERGALLRG